MHIDDTSHQSVIPRDRTAFLHLMRMWFVQTGRTTDEIPRIGERLFDLYQLYIEVETLGGPEKVQVAGLWRLVAVKMGYATHDQNDLQLAQIANVLADAYTALIIPFDKFCLERMRAATNTNYTSHQLQCLIPRDRQAFLHLMRMWFVQTGRTIDEIPIIEERPVDLHQLFIEVETLGGPEKVLVAGLWRLVAIKMGCVTYVQNDPRLGQTAKTLADAYDALLVPFNDFCHERMRAVRASMNNNPFNSGSAGSGPSVRRPDGNTMAMPNFQRILAFLQVTLRNWLPEQSAQVKLLRASQMNEQDMQAQGWPPEMIAVVHRFRPALLQYRAIVIRQQEQEQEVGQAQVYQQQPQPHTEDHQSEIDIQEFERYLRISN